MAGETPITVVGNLTADPELAFMPDGRPHCRFTVASTPRRFDRDSQEWRDGDTTFLPVYIVGAQAEHAAESLSRGSRVVVLGSLEQQSWETREGQKRSRLRVRAEEVAASVRWGPASAQRAERGPAADQGPPEQDPWGSRVPGTSGFSGGGSAPPF